MGIKMKALDYIHTTRQYVDYMEEHILNVAKAYELVISACAGLSFIVDSDKLSELRAEVELHDLSKFSMEEFVQYRDKFYPAKSHSGVCKGVFDKAWKHHLESNSHHHESAITDIDIFHMVIDWTAMGFKFGDTAEEYYYRNLDSVKLSSDKIALLQTIFVCLREYK